MTMAIPPRTPNEHTIATIPLKKKYLMTVTSHKLTISHKDLTELVIPLSDVRAIIPIKKDKIRIQFRNAANMRMYVEHTMDKPQYSATQVCHNILQEHDTLSTWGKNTHGMLLLKPGEDIVHAIPDTDSKQGKGILYITSTGVAFETSTGIECDIPYDIVSLVTQVKRDRVRIVWREAVQQTTGREKSKEFKLDFHMPSGVGCPQTITMITNTISAYRNKMGFRFAELDHFFSGMSNEELYAAACEHMPDLTEYLQRYAVKMYGYTVEWFAGCDRLLILACKLLSIDTEVISHISKEEQQDRNQAVRICAMVRKRDEDLKKCKDTIKQMEDGCTTTSDLKKMTESSQYKEIVGRIKDLKEAVGHPKFAEYDPRIMDAPSAEQLSGYDTIFTENTARVVDEVYSVLSLRSADRRIEMLYDEWCKTNAAPDVRDEYDPKYLEYLLHVTDNHRGRRIGPSGRKAVINFEDIHYAIKTRDRHSSILGKFEKPEGIPDDQVYNNCWFDKEADMWYVFGDMLPYMEKWADTDPDASQNVCGRRVWGFKSERVDKWWGWPSVRMIFGDAESMLPFQKSRRDGQTLYHVRLDERGTFLPVLREDDIQQVMERFRSTTVLTTEALRYTVVGSGYVYYCTPRQYDHHCAIHKVNKPPVSERLRRAKFLLDSGGIGLLDDFEFDRPECTVKMWGEYNLDVDFSATDGGEGLKKMLARHAAGKGEEGFFGAMSLLVGPYRYREHLRKPDGGGGGGGDDGKQPPQTVSKPISEVFGFTGF